jgi:repressor LexA
MMQAMGLRSPAPVQSRLRHLQQKGWITWQEGQARTLQLLGGLISGIPVLGAVAAGGLVETFDDIQERIDLAPVLETRGLFALTVNGDSMVDAYIADGDVVLMEPVLEPSRLRDGTVVSALVPGSGTTLKHFHRKGATVRLEAANTAYEPIELPADQVQVQGKLVAVWRQV